MPFNILHYLACLLIGKYILCRLLFGLLTSGLSLRIVALTSYTISSKMYLVSFDATYLSCLRSDNQLIVLSVWLVFWQRNFQYWSIHLLYAIPNIDRLQGNRWLTKIGRIILLVGDERNWHPLVILMLRYYHKHFIEIRLEITFHRPLRPPPLLAALSRGVAFPAIWPLWRVSGITCTSNASFRQKSYFWYACISVLLFESKPHC